ncbi:hypothetical protein [Ktedonosporobacter rubrisoli]|nr:hypothetical protein [Ktedonosporobacter rubrisoli]
MFALLRNLLRILWRSIENYLPYGIAEDGYQRFEECEKKEDSASAE